MSLDQQLAWAAGTVLVFMGVSVLTNSLGWGFIAAGGLTFAGVAVARTALAPQGETDGK